MHRYFRFQALVEPLPERGQVLGAPGLADDYERVGHLPEHRIRDRRDSSLGYRRVCLEDRLDLSQPPRTGPIAIATPATADHALTAIARSFASSKMTTAMAKAAGKTSAANTPRPALAAIN